MSAAWVVVCLVPLAVYGICLSFQIGGLRKRVDLLERRLKHLNRAAARATEHLRQTQRGER